MSNIDVAFAIDIAASLNITVGEPQIFDETGFELPSYFRELSEPALDVRVGIISVRRAASDGRFLSFLLPLHNGDEPILLTVNFAEKAYPHETGYTTGGKVSPDAIGVPSGTRLALGGSGTSGALLYVARDGEYFEFSREPDNSIVVVDVPTFPPGEMPVLNPGPRVH